MERSLRWPTNEMKSHIIMRHLMNFRPIFNCEKFSKTFASNKISHFKVLQHIIWNHFLLISIRFIPTYVHTIRVFGRSVFQMNEMKFWKDKPKASSLNRIDAIHSTLTTFRSWLRSSPGLIIQHQLCHMIVELTKLFHLWFAFR